MGGVSGSGLLSPQADWLVVSGCLCLALGSGGRGGARVAANGYGSSGRQSCEHMVGAQGRWAQESWTPCARPLGRGGCPPKGEHSSVGQEGARPAAGGGGKPAEVGLACACPVASGAVNIPF